MGKSPLTSSSAGFRGFFVIPALEYLKTAAATRQNQFKKKNSQ
jgi:hypothetical protein